MSIPLDPVVLAAIGVFFTLGLALLKGYASGSATETRSRANEKRIEQLELSLHEYQLQAVGTFVTNATLKEATSNFAASVDRLTDRLDRLITDKTGMTK